MTADRNPWQIERDRLVSEIVHDAWALARAGTDLSNPDWWPSVHRIVAHYRDLLALAASTTQLEDAGRD